MKRKPPAVHSIGIDRDAQALEAFVRDYPVGLVPDCVHASLASVRFTGPELFYFAPEKGAPGELRGPELH